MKRVSPDLLAKYPDISWRAIMGFRDVLIHDYDKIDVDEVWLTIDRDLPPLRVAVEALLAALPSDEDG